MLNARIELRGDRQACSMVRVPTPEEEDAKRPHREREHLVQERLRIENRIEALLFTQGIRQRPSLRSWERDLAALRTGDGSNTQRSNGTASIQSHLVHSKSRSSGDGFERSRRCLPRLG